MDAAERFAPVPGYPGYRVSDAGRVQTRRHRNGLPAPGWRDLAPGADGRGYPQVRLYRPGARPRWRHVHLLVLEAFIGPRPPGLVARHGPAGPGVPALWNLSYGTRSENMADKWRDGTAQTRDRRRGYWSGDQARRVYARWLAGETVGAIARELGVSYNRAQQAVCRARRRFLGERTRENLAGTH